MSGELVLRPCDAPLERVEADVVAVGVFSDERPLRGGAGRIDWRLCGQISALIRCGRSTGSAGDAVLLPSLGRIAAPRVLALGLGPRAGFGESEFSAAVREALRRALGLGAACVALPPLGIPPEDFSRHARAFVEGALEALGDARVELRLAVPEIELGGTVRALVQAAGRGPVQVIAPETRLEPRRPAPHGVVPPENARP